MVGHGSINTFVALILSDECTTSPPRSRTASVTSAECPTKFYNMPCLFTSVANRPSIISDYHKKLTAVFSNLAVEEVLDCPR